MKLELYIYIYSFFKLIIFEIMEIFFNEFKKYKLLKNEHIHK